jgi:hypothetical protein
VLRLRRFDGLGIDTRITAEELASAVDYSRSDIPFNNESIEYLLQKEHPSSKSKAWAVLHEFIERFPPAPIKPRREVDEGQPTDDSYR